MTPFVSFSTLIVVTGAFAQGTFYYDQQSSTYEVPDGYNVGPAIETLLPYTGQSFTPGFSAVNFVRLKFQDGDITDGVGATIYLNLRSDSSLQFSNPVAVTPGTTCYFEPLAERSCDAGIGFSVIPAARRS